MFDKAKTAKGNYTLLAKRHGCTEPQNDFCVLTPTVDFTTEFKANQPHGPEDSFFFRADTELADSGRAQQLALVAKEIATPNALSMQLRDSDTTTVLGSAPSTSPSPGDTHHLLINRPEAQTKPLYLVVHRNNPAAAVSAKTSWRTNLTVLHGLLPGRTSTVEQRLIAHTQEDLTGDDDIAFSLKVDDAIVIDRHYLGGFDDSSQAGLDALIGTRAFLTDLAVRLHEIDDIDPWDDSGWVTIASLDPLTAHHYDASKTLTFGGSGLYEYKHNLSHVSLQP